MRDAHQGLEVPANFTATTVGGAAIKAWRARSSSAAGWPSRPRASFTWGLRPFNLHIRDANGVTFFDAPGFISRSATSPITGQSATLWQNLSWQFDHFEYLGNPGGPYTINLTGAQFVPEPATPLALLGIAVARGFVRRRR